MRGRGSPSGSSSATAPRPGFNDMATTRPDLAAELVGTDPTTVFAQTNKVLLWRCPNHDEPYPATGADRARGYGCGYCRGLRVLPGFNDMATTRPDLAAELVGTDPTTVIAGTTRPLLWRCPNHDEPYPASGTDRARGSGCGYCSRPSGSARVQRHGHHPARPSGGAGRHRPHLRVRSDEQDPSMAMPEPRQAVSRQRREQGQRIRVRLLPRPSTSARVQ